MIRKRLSMFLWLWTAAVLPAVAKDTDTYYLSFQVYPPGTRWWQQKLDAEKFDLATVTTEQPLPIKAADIKQSKHIKVWFYHPHCGPTVPEDIPLGEFWVNEDRKYLIKDPEKDGLLEWPDPILLQPRSLWAVYYRLHEHWLLTVLTGLSMATALLFGWRRQHQNRRLQQRQRLWEKLAAQASHRDDPLVKDQKTLGPYKIIDKLGEGGMATVYKAVPTETLDEREAVAIKLMKSDLTSPEDRKRFLREIQVVRQLNHPHIVRLEHYGETPQNELYMAMELVDGSPLAIHPQGQSVEEVSVLLRPILQALTYAHGRGVVHRDIKPGNVLVTRSGQVKLMDFGLARTHDASQVTKTGTMLGSPAYAPPEQLTGGLLDPRADQYSLGATLYEMLTGSVPFEKADVMAVLMAHMLELPPPLRDRRPDLSLSIERVVLRMLEKSPQARFSDMAEMGKAWEQALRDPNAFADWVRPAAAVSETGEPLLPGNISPQSSGADTIC